MEYRITPRDLRRRKEILVWMQRMNWPWEIIDAVMYRDNPDQEYLRKLVYRIGPVRAFHLICYMNSQTEYEYDGHQCR